MAMQQEAIQEEVLTIYKAYFLAYVREYPQNIWPYMVLTYLHFRILKCLGESCYFFALPDRSFDNLSVVGDVFFPSQIIMILTDIPWD